MQNKNLLPFFSIIRQYTHDINCWRQIWSPENVYRTWTDQIKCHSRLFRHL